MTIKGVLTTSERRFVDSSHFRYGGETYKVYTEKTRCRFLPGKYNPKDYLAELSFPEDLSGQTVIVVCPGNGHFIAECALRGATRIIAISWNVFVDKTLDGVVPLISVNFPGVAFEVHKIHPSRMNEQLKDSLKGQADLIVWLDEFVVSANPKGEILALMPMLKPGAQMWLNVYHGQSRNTNPHIAMAHYTPTAETFLGFIQRINEMERREQQPILVAHHKKSPIRTTDCVYLLSVKQEAKQEAPVAETPKEDEKSVSTDTFEAPKLEDLEELTSKVSVESLDQFVEELSDTKVKKRRQRKKVASESKTVS